MVKIIKPELLVSGHGSVVARPGDWHARLESLLPTVLDIEYGGMPPVVEARGRLLGRSAPRRPFAAKLAQFHVMVEEEQSFHFRMDVAFPAEGTGPFPVLLCGDGCWWYVNDVTRKMVLDRGYALAVFNRTELVRDIYHRHDAREGGLYDVFPGREFGAIAAWAWGYHRCIDVLQTVPEIDAERIAVTGHSRGGKATLLAGATDKRIALTNTNNSGCCGAGSHQVHGEGCETLAAILKNFPHWFGPKLCEYIGRDDALPFDQHVLKAAVAPRALLSTEALGDAWANPLGTWHTHEAARPVYELLGAGERMAIHYRAGGHAHGPEDFNTLLDFMDQQWRGRDVATRFNVNPFA